MTREASRTVDRRRVARWLTTFLLLMSATLGVGAAASEQRSREELMQPFLGDDYSRWLMGGIHLMASDAEVEGYLTLRDDEAARAYIDAFWSRRDAVVRDLYEQRASYADDEFSEGHVAGRLTDRGAIYTVYGPPASIEYEEFRDVSEPDVELWRYTKKAERGLDGKKPGRIYRFARQGDLTSFYKPPSTEELRRRARMRGPIN